MPNEMNGTTKLTAKDFKGKVNPDWCPGCGDFGVLNALQRACAELGLPNHEVMVVSGIGCSSNFPGFFKANGMHTLHGRSLPVATGFKLANHEMKVVATGGDGDGYAIGVGHFVHAARRNVDLTYVVMDNQIYGLTTGQISPTSQTGMQTKSTPNGNLELPFNPLTTAITAGATFVARGFSGDIKHLANLLKQGMEHKGFALIDVFSPCVTFNKVNTFAWFKQRVKRLEDSDHDPSDWQQAMTRAMEWGEEIPIGLFYQTEARAAHHELESVLQQGGALANRKLGLSKTTAQGLIDKML